MKYLICISVLLVTLTSASVSYACASGARCLSAPKTSEPLFVPGDVLDPGSFNVLLNSDYYGLPRATAGTWYVTIERRVLRIDAQTLAVIEDVTNETNRAF